MLSDLPDDAWVPYKCDDNSLSHPVQHDNNSSEVGSKQDDKDDPGTPYGKGAVPPTLYNSEHDDTSTNDKSQEIASSSLCHLPPILPKPIPTQAFGGHGFRSNPVPRINLRWSRKHSDDNSDYNPLLMKHSQALSNHIAQDSFTLLSSNSNLPVLCHNQRVKSMSILPHYGPTHKKLNWLGPAFIFLGQILSRNLSEPSSHYFVLPPLLHFPILSYSWHLNP